MGALPLSSRCLQVIRAVHMHAGNALLRADPKGPSKMHRLGRCVKHHTTAAVRGGSTNLFSELQGYLVAAALPPGRTELYNTQDCTDQTLLTKSASRAWGLRASVAPSLEASRRRALRRCSRPVGGGESQSYGCRLHCVSACHLPVVTTALAW